MAINKMIIFKGNELKYWMFRRKVYEKEGTTRAVFWGYPNKETRDSNIEDFSKSLEIVFEGDIDVPTCYSKAASGECDSDILKDGEEV